jgi:hypothetical protein
MSDSRKTGQRTCRPQLKHLDLPFLLLLAFDASGLRSPNSEIELNQLVSMDIESDGGSLYPH